MSAAGREDPQALAAAEVPVAAACRVLAAETAAAAVPEASFGIVCAGRLIVGQGEERIYRIASMTKSFTAAAVLGLARGLIPAAGRRLHLDDLLTDWLPELADWAAGMTIRDALTMSTGLPTDDPWADRLESMPAAEFRALLAAPALRNSPAGAGYEYANFGYALLGAVIEAAAGRAYAQVVGEHLLSPLGLADTGFDVRRLAADRLVTGYRRTADGRLEAQELSTPGAFSAIGGLASTVADVAVWIGALAQAAASAAPGPACWALAAGSGEPDHADGQTAARAADWRRVLADLQQPQRPISLSTAADHAVITSYGYGLRCRFDTRFGAIAGHSGGYPGFGLHMRWHAATGIGLVLLTNLTGFPTEAVAARALDALLGELKEAKPQRRDWWPQPAPDTLTPLQRKAAEEAAEAGDAEEAGDAGERQATVQPAAQPEGVSFAVPPSARFAPSQLAQSRARAAEHMIATGDDAAVAELFSPNMDLDIPRSERLQLWAEARAATGEDAGTDGTGASGMEITWTTALSARWEVSGPQGRRRVEMGLNPAGLIQRLSVSIR